MVDSLDLDSDNDGISDYYESTFGTADAGKDTNNDGAISLTESADVDKDGLMDVFDADTTSANKTTSTASIGSIAINTDGDSRADYLDLDSDGDGIADTVEARLTAGYVANDGDVRNNDADKDGIINLFDSNDGTTKLFGGSFVNPVNTDAAFPAGFNDTTPDYLDTDSDGDGETDDLESGLSTVNTDANSDGIRDSVIPVTTAPYSDPDGIIVPTSLTNTQNPGTVEVDYRELPVLTINDPVVNENAGTMSFTLGLTGGALPRAVTVTFSVTNGSALAGSDYTAPTTLTVTIPANSATATISIPIIDDTLFEGAVGETLNVNLLSAIGATIVDNLGVGTITDNDLAPRVSTITPATIVEGGNLLHTVTLTNPSATTTTFALSLTGTTATAVTDFNNILTNASFSNGVTYNATTGLISVPANITSFTVTYTTVNDALNEASETTSLTIGGVTAVGTITDNDPIPTLSINNIQVDESAGTATFTVTLSAASGQTVTVAYNTSNGSALAGSDYTNASGTLTFAPGELTKTIVVSITDDLLYEGPVVETYNVNLTTATNATIADNLGLGTITDNDLPPSLSINDVVVNEGAGTATFTVSLNAASGLPVSVDFTTSDGTAKAGSDFTNTTGTLTFAPGELTKTVTVNITNDIVYEGTVAETFNVNLVTPVNATLADNLGIGSITENDLPPVATITVSPANVSEDGAPNLIYTVSLSNPSSVPVTVNLTTTGTATRTADYAGAVTTVTIPAGSTSTTITIDPKIDNEFEPNETVIISLAAGTGYTVGTANSATGTITNDDLAPTVESVSGNTQLEGQTLLHQVKLTNPSSTPTTFAFSFSGGTATGGGVDYNNLPIFSNGVTYNPLTGTITVPAGVTLFNVTVQSLPDTIAEGANETYNLTVGGKTGVGTIIDVPPTLEVSLSDAPTVDEGGNLVYTVTMTGGTSANDIILNVTYTGTAIDGTDFTGIGDVIIAAGQTSGILTVATNTDAVLEGDETVIATLDSPPNGVTIIDGEGFGTITDTTALTVSISDAATVNEGGNLIYTVKLNGTSTTDISIPLTYAGTSDPVLDINGQPIEAIILAGDSSTIITVETLPDTVLEGNETVLVNLGNPAGQPPGAAAVTIADGQASGTIIDTSTLSVVISDAAVVNEGDNLVYTVTLSGTSTSDITLPVSYTGKATNGIDYTNVATVVIKAGQTTGVLNLSTKNDTILEGLETVVVTLGTPTGQPVGAASIVIADGQASGTVSDATELTVTLSDAVAVDEGQSLQYTVTLSGTSTTDITVPLTYGGSADPVLDHSGQPITVTIKAGDTTATVSVPTRADSVLEGDESVAITLGNPSGQPASANPVGIGDGEGTGTITDTSQLSVSIADAPTVDEGGNLNYLVTLSGTSITDLTIPVTYSGTAADGSDYTQVATVTIKAGDTTGTLSLVSKADSQLEGPETVIVRLGEPTGQPVGAATVSVVDGEANGNITDTSTLSVAISDAAAVDEGQSLQYTVTLSGGTSSTDLSIPLTYGGSADPVLDFNGQPITVTIKAGETTATVSVPTQGDSVLEGDETVTVTLGNPSGQAVGAAPVTVSDGVASGTVSDATELTVTLSDAVAVAEGQSLQYTVSLSGTSTTDITVPLTYGGSADPVLDHSGQPVTVTIKAGDTTATVSVPTQADSVLEGDETVAITLGNPSGQPASANPVSIGDGEGTGTITDTSQLTVSVSDAVAVDEGGNLNYLVTLSGASTTDITIPVTYSGTAADGSDYTQVATVTIKAGDTTGTLSLVSKADSQLEGPETVIVRLGEPTGQAVGAATVSVVDGEANGNITDTSTLSIAISDAVAVDEGQSLQYLVTLSGGTSTTDLSIPLTYGGSADPVLDLNGQPITVTIKAGETTATVSVPTQGDSVLEGDETVTVTLGNPSGQAVGAAPVTVSDGVASGTVSDATELTVTLSDAVAVDEGQSLQYTVTLSGTSTTDITVPLTYGGSADPVLDHSGQPVTVTIKAGDTTATVSVPTQGDSVLEGDESVAITLGNPSGQPASANPVGIGDGEGTGTITDTSQLSVSIADAPTVDEGGNLNYLVTLSGTSTTDITIPVTYSGTAADGSDYTRLPRSPSRPGRAPAP